MSVNGGIARLRGNGGEVGVEEVQLLLTELDRLLLDRGAKQQLVGSEHTPDVGATVGAAVGTELLGPEPRHVAKIGDLHAMRAPRPASDLQGERVVKKSGACCVIA